MSAQTLTVPAVHYPDSDGEPIAENTLQFKWIVTIEGNLDALFANDPKVFVAGDLLWYPVEGHPEIRTAPDTMVVFGRPKGHRGSYRQWEEDGVAPQVVFEVLSPGNRFGKMLKKFEDYERFGVEEYYLLDPDTNAVEGWLRRGDRLREIPEMNGWVSPRLGIRFDLAEPEVILRRPDGQPFLSFAEIFVQWEASGQRAEQERQRAEQERQRAEQAEQRAEQERLRAERLAAKLREMGQETDA